MIDMNMDIAQPRLQHYWKIGDEGLANPDMFRISRYFN